MTTQDQRSDVTGSYDQQPQVAVSETQPQTQPLDDRTMAASSADRSVDLTEPAAPSGEPAPAAEPPVEAAAPAQHSAVESESSTEAVLFADDELADMRSRWAGVQAAFVDDPKDCVQKADVLVSDLVDQLTTGFSHARSRLEEQWARGEEASTEDLRVALMHYREFFERLLAV
ncbi:MAG: hypothetical protein QOD58_451 [Mycobacterium sp.]|nr:hypothetical protein [Mycobacterium sp.]